MPPISLNLLRKGDRAAWNETFDWLWPTVLAVARLKLQPFLPADVEDVAIEALEELVDKVREVQTIEELKPLAASIAHNRAVSLLRKRFAKRRGEGKIAAAGQPSGPSDDGSSILEVPDEAPALDVLDRAELSGLLAELQRCLAPQFRAVFEDFFSHGLSYREIADEHGFAIGSVGVYLKRGLEALRKAAQRQPNLLKELKAFLR